MKEHTMFQLGKRLSLCASLVRPGARLADIGADHGYLSIWLAKNGLVSQAIAADVREGPLQSARQNIAKYGAEGAVSARLSDGLSAFRPEEADDVAVAGMGGELIARIVSQAPWLRTPEKHLILQPMTSAEDLRAFLSREGFALFREEAVTEDGHTYSAMLCWYDPPLAARQGAEEAFPYAGLVDGGTGAGRAYLLARAASLKKRAAGLRMAGRAEEAARAERLQQELERRAGEKGDAT